MKALCASIVLLVGALPAMAGIADSPLPTLSGSAIHLYDVPGVSVVYDPGGSFSVDTYVVCTSAEPAATLQFTVEVFGGSGGAPINTATPITLGPGATGWYLFGTSSSADYWAQWAANLASSYVPNTPGIQGSARIVSTSKKLLCSAFIADNTGTLNPPRQQLNIMYKLKQKGD